MNFVRHIFKYIFAKISKKYTKYIIVGISICLVVTCIILMILVSMLRQENIELYNLIYANNTKMTEELNLNNIGEKKFIQYFIKTNELQSKIYQNESKIQFYQKIAEVFGTIGTIMFIYGEVFLLMSFDIVDKKSIIIAAQ